MNVFIFTFILSAWAFGAAIDVPILENGGSKTFATENLRSRRGTLTPPPEAGDMKELNRLIFSDLHEQNAEIKKVKYYLLNGETRLAHVHLTKLAYKQTKLKPIIYRYLAVLSFIEGRFQKSLEYLELKELQSLPHYSKICNLKVLNQVVLSEVRVLESEWNKCRELSLKEFDSDHMIWMETLVRLKVRPAEGLTKVPFKGVKLSALDNQQLKIFLKLAIYLNQEALVEPQITTFDLSQIQDQEIRELIGHIYFRLGSLAKSFRFVEDLTSPNAENIKGNLYVLRNKYEIAYAQFKLALAKKENSQNAMERIIPLAWLLGDWEEGAKYAERVIASPQTQINKMTLISAFYAQKGDYNKANDVLRTIAIKSRKGAELDVTQLHSFVGLMENKSDIARKQSHESCDQFDLINCWVSFQMDQWDSFPLLLRRADPVPSKKEWERLSQNEENDPLQETVYVNQLDIEELDDKLVKLIPHAP